MKNLFNKIKYDLAHKFYLIGYEGRTLPRLLRKILIKTELHRAWLAGKHGIFDEVIMEM